MKTVLLTNYYSTKPLELLRGLLPKGFVLLSLPRATKEELVKEAPQADYFLASGRIPIDREVISAASKLKMIQRTGVGLDTIDLSALKNSGIPLYVNPGINAGSVAEHTILLILASLRNLPGVNSLTKAGCWKKQELGLESNELAGKKIGLIGLGDIGTYVAKLLQVFGADVLYYKRNRLPMESEREMSINYLSFADLLSHVDILSLHCPLNENTYKLIGKKEMLFMKPGSIIINTSRGQLIDEEALFACLQSGHIKAAGLDVFYEEPVSPDNPLLALENVIATPHIAGVTYESFNQMMREALTNILLFDQGKTTEIKGKRII